jgi:hypothetical protein
MNQIKKMAIGILLLTITACGKNSIDDPIVEDPHNHSLRKKTLDEIKAEIKGEWVFKRACGCGFLGCSCNAMQAGDNLFFLTNDTVKRVTNGIVNIYEKATITRRYLNAFNDSAYVYNLGGGIQMWAMDEIKKDTLVIAEGTQTSYFLTRP